MQLARSVRTLGLLLLLGLAGSGGGCGLGSQAAVDQGRQEQIRESKKTAHRQRNEDSRKAGESAKQQGAMRRGARRGPAGG
jgi:hypothetical protein